MAPAPDRSAQLVPRPFSVTRIRRELGDVWTLELQAADGGAPIAFQPGQFTMIYGFGIGEAPISISGNPTTPDRLVHTVRAVGAVSRAICTVRKGDTLGIRGPFGRPWPVDAAKGRDVIIMAGGLGLAPLRPLIYSVLARRGAFGRVALLVGARTPDTLLFAREVSRWRGRFDVEVRATVDAGDARWNGEVGVITTLVPRVTFDAANTTAYVCGPEVMMRFAAATLIERGVPSDQIFLSMERNMKCAVTVCGRCQFGPSFVCTDGPVFPYARVATRLLIREI